MKFLLRIRLIILFLVLLNESCGNSKKIAEDGIRLLQAGKQTTALEHFDEALRADKNESLAQFGKGIILSQEGITRHIAQDLLEKAYPKLNVVYKPACLIRLSEIYLKSGKHEEALAFMAKSVELKNLNFVEISQLVDLYIALKDNARAKEKLTSYLEGNPQDEFALHKLFQVYHFHLKDSKAALALCSQAGLKFSHASLLSDCAKLYAIQKQYDESLKLVELFLKTHPSTANVGEITDGREQLLKKRWSPKLER